MNVALPAVAVTGATGFVGGHFVDHLAAAGREVVRVHRKGRVSPESTDGVRDVVDVGDPEVLAAHLSSHGVGAVVHLATHFVAHHTPVDVEPLVDANLGFATRVAEAARLAGCDRFINASTAWQHLGGEPYRPVSLYAATKQAFEAVLRHYSDNAGLSVATLVLFDSYGPGDRRRKLVPLLLDAEVSGRTLEMSSGRQLIDLLHVSDIARAFSTLVSGPAMTGRWVLSSGAPLPVRELVETFVRVRESELRVVFDVLPDRPNEMREPWHVGATLPGWSPDVSLEHGLAALSRTA